MGIVLVLAVLAGGAFLLTRKKKEVRTQPVAIAPTESVQSVAQASAASPRYSAGTTLRHNETGQKVEILSAPGVVDGEYKILWVTSGGTGMIHQAQLESQFTRL